MKITTQGQSKEPTMRLCKEGCGMPVKAPKDTMCYECRRVYEKARYEARTARTVAWRKKARADGLLAKPDLILPEPLALIRRIKQLFKGE